MNPRFLISLTITVAFSLVLLAHTAAAKPIPGPVTPTPYLSQTPYLSEGTFGFGPEQAATQSQPQTGMSKAEYRALMLRSEGLNEKYGLGQWATTKPIVSEKVSGLELPPPSSTQVASSGNEFDWSDAGIGAAAVFGTVLLGAGLVLTIRRREFPLAH
jgi:hypothetical protein